MGYTTGNWVIHSMVELFCSAGKSVFGCPAPALGSVGVCLSDFLTALHLSLNTFANLPFSLALKPLSSNCRDGALLLYENAS